MMKKKIIKILKNIINENNNEKYLYKKMIIMIIINSIFEALNCCKIID